MRSQHAWAAWLSYQFGSLGQCDEGVGVDDHRLLHFAVESRDEIGDARRAAEAGAKGDRGHVLGECEDFVGRGFDHVFAGVGQAVRHVTRVETGDDVLDRARHDERDESGAAAERGQAGERDRAAHAARAADHQRVSERAFVAVGELRAASLGSGEEVTSEICMTKKRSASEVRIRGVGGWRSGRRDRRL